MRKVESFGKIEVIKGDITTIQVDAIVNAANNSLLGGGGVDGAIHRAGGPVILEECRKIVFTQGPCETGNAVITSAGNLPSRFVIHAVGPVWIGGNSNESQKLRNCYLNSLKLAIENKCKSIAFPNISTGVYGFPKSKAAEVATKTVVEFLKSNVEMERVIFVCFDEENFDLIKSSLGMLQ